MNVKTILLYFFIIFYFLPIVINAIVFIINSGEDAYGSKLSISDFLLVTLCPVFNCFTTGYIIYYNANNILVKNKIIKQQNKNEKITIKGFENDYIVKKFGIYFSIYNSKNYCYIDSDFIKEKHLIKKLIDHNGFTYNYNKRYIICFDTQSEALNFLEFLDSIFIIEKIEQNVE